jgi:membrane fusion protein, copper/silver efflux system
MKLETVRTNGNGKVMTVEAEGDVTPGAEVIFPRVDDADGRRAELPAAYGRATVLTTTALESEVTGEARPLYTREETLVSEVTTETRASKAEGEAVVTEVAEKVEVRAVAKGRANRKTALLAVAAVAVVALAALFFLRREKEGQAVPAPAGVGLTTQQTTQGESGRPDGAFRISPEKQQLIGVQYGTVEYQDTSKSLRAVGRVAYDETKIVRISPKVEGWIEQVFVDFTGKQVKKGQPLLSIYSPDLVQTQAEYLLALRGREELSASEFADAAKFSASLVESARRRLELWDISKQQIDALEKRGTPVKAMTLYAPADGFVLTRNAFPRQRVTPETELYALADLSKIWVMADVYEFEAADIREGLAADVTLSAYPGRTFRGRVAYINPQLESSTRTLKVRVELQNPGFLLKPDMFADVTFRITGARSLVVPAEAVMDSGSEQTVFVSLGDGYFEPRKVTLGGKVDNKYVVTSGLKAGEQVVTSGNFLIDSESKLKSATDSMGGGHNHGGAAPAGGAKEAQPTQGATGAGHEGHQQANPQGAPANTAPRTVLFWYDPMHPAYKSDKPGKAPDCGMDLVPKYSDEN